MRCIKKRFIYGFISFGMLLTFLLDSKSAKAENGFNLVQRANSDDKSFLYVTGVKDVNSKIQCQIGKDYINDVSMGYCENSDRMSQTLILFDNSASVPKNRRVEFDKIVKGLILNKMPNERMCLATFNSKIKFLSDFTDDKKVLYKALKTIKYRTQSTYLTDVLYNIIKNYNSSRVNVFKRIIVLSDGFDNKKFGITKMELMNKLRETPYYIATIGCENGDNDKDLKNMFAVSRTTNAKNYLLDDKKVSVKNVIKELSLEKSFAKITINIPKGMQDGSKKSVCIRLNDKQVLTTDIKLPFPSKEDESVKKGFVLTPFMKNTILIVSACIGVFLILSYIIMRKSYINFFIKPDVYTVISKEYNGGHNAHPNPMLRIVEDYDKLIEKNDLLGVEQKGSIEKI